MRRSATFLAGVALTACGAAAAPSYSVTLNPGYAVPVSQDGVYSVDANHSHAVTGDATWPDCALQITNPEGHVIGNIIYHAHDTPPRTEPDSLFLRAGNYTLTFEDSLSLGVYRCKDATIRLVKD